MALGTLQSVVNPSRTGSLLDAAESRKLTRRRKTGISP